MWLSPESESVVDSEAIVEPITTFSLTEKEDREIFVGTVLEKTVRLFRDGKPALIFESYFQI